MRQGLQWFFLPISVVRMQACVGVALRQRNLRQNHRDEHQHTAGVFPDREDLVQQHHAGQHGEHALQRKEQRDDRGVGAALRDDLQRIGDAAGADAHIQQRPCAALRRAPIHRFKSKGKRCGNDRVHGELDAGEPDAVHKLHEMIHTQDLQRKKYGAEQQIKIARLQIEALSGLKHSR